MDEYLAPIAKNTRTLAADYTTARAAKLDNLDAAISAITPIRSIQRGTIVISNGSSSNTATITAVTTGKTELTMLGKRLASGSSGLIDSEVEIDLTNTTTITATRGGNTGAVTVRWQAVEYK